MSTPGDSILRWIASPRASSLYSPRGDPRGNDLGPTTKPGFRQDVVDMVLRGANRDPQSASDGCVAEPVGHESDHLAFPGAERREHTGQATVRARSEHDQRMTKHAARTEVHRDGLIAVEALSHVEQGRPGSAAWVAPRRRHGPCHSTQRRRVEAITYHKGRLLRHV